MTEGPDAPAGAAGARSGRPDAALGAGAEALTEEAAWELLRRYREADSPIRVSPSGKWRGPWTATPPARDLLNLFLPLRLASHLVIGQLGQSLDGRIATLGGHSHYINGPDDIRRLHRLRALVDAVVVGAGTVHADDPRLTVREVTGDNPVRVVLDPSGRLASTYGVFCDGAAPTLWLQSARCADSSRRGGDGRPTKPSPPPGSHPVEVVHLEERAEGGFEPASIVALLAERGLRRVLVEGGGVTVSRFLQAGALDRLHISVAPLLIGSGRPALTLPPVERLDEALRPPVRHFRLGDDLLFDLDLSGR